MNLKNLNPNQLDAVKTTGGPILIFAGAGSGKTRVLTYKLAYLIQEVGLPPENILAVTFTNKAAQEMKERVTSLVKVDLSSMNIGTFHSICASILRRHIHHLLLDKNITPKKVLIIILLSSLILNIIGGIIYFTLGPFESLISFVLFMLIYLMMSFTIIKKI